MRELNEQHRIVAAPAVAITPAPQGTASDELETEIRKLTRWKRCMSYNDSYFGEPAGLVKSVAHQLDRILDRPPAPQAARSAPTELEHRLLETADQQPGWKPLLTAAADEIKRLRAAVTQAAPSEPVAMVDDSDDGMFASILPNVSVMVGQMLYTAPASPQQAQADARYAALEMLQYVLPHIPPKAIDLQKALSGPIKDAYINTQVRKFLELAAATTSTEGR
jgi:hypothetical protein